MSSRRALALALVLWTQPLLAHPQFALTTVNRYSKVVLLPRGQVRIIYTLMVGDAPAHALRRRADHDGDGRLSELEGAALARDLMAQVARGLTVEVDGGPAVPRFAEPVLGLAGDAVAPSAFSIDAAAVLALPPGRPHTLRYEDQAGIQPAGEVEILVEEGPGVRLLESCQGSPRPDRPERVTAFRFYGPPTSSLSDRSITVRFIEPQAAPGGARRWPVALLAATSGFFLLILGWLRRARRTRKER